MVNAWTELHLPVLTDNIRMVRDRLPPGTELIFVVKSEAYGHGMLKVARRLESEVPAFAVVMLLEKAGDVLLREELEPTRFDRGEGLRYLSRLLRAGLISFGEATGPTTPAWIVAWSMMLSWRMAAWALPS